MKTEQRLARLEVIAMNQILIIDQLSSVISKLAPASLLQSVMDESAETMLSLMYEDGVPLSSFDLATEWRQGIASPDIMRIS